MICKDIWHKYHEGYFEIVIRKKYHLVRRMSLTLRLSPWRVNMAWTRLQIKKKMIKSNTRKDN